MRLLIVEPQPLVADQCRALQRDDPAIEIAESHSAIEGLAVYRTFLPAVTIVDVHLSGRTGLDLIRQIRSIDPQARILACARRDISLRGPEAIEAGAMGFHAVAGELGELKEAIGHVAAGRWALAGQAAQSIVMSRLGLTTKGPPGLTVRQIEILRLMSQDLSMAEIAARLGVSYKTVITDRARLRTLLGARSQGDLIRIAIELRLL